MSRLQLGDRVRITEHTFAKMRADNTVHPDVIGYASDLIGAEGEVVGTFMPFNMVRVLFGFVILLLESSWVEPVDTYNGPIQLPEKEE